MKRAEDRPQVQLLHLLHQHATRMESLLDNAADWLASILDGVARHGTCSSTFSASRQSAILIAFAMLLTAIEAARRGRTPQAQLADQLLPSTQDRHGFWNPLHQQLKYNAPLKSAVDQLLSSLADMHLATILQSFARQHQTSRPLGYLLERLLAESSESRRAHGVYFTPAPVIRYMASSVDTVLKERLCYSAGLATREPKLCIVDPACGSGLFLLGILEYRLHDESVGDESGARCKPNDTVGSDLVGIDIVPACIIATHLILEHERLATGSDRASAWKALAWKASARTVQLWCANPLDQPELSAQLFADHVPVIIGNPPYANFGGHNRGPWIRTQLEAYKTGLNERKLNLDDDYIKFLRWGQYWIDRAGRGVLAMITNNSFLTGLTHRRMRQSFLDTFDYINVLNLHGSANRPHDVVRVARDENIFDIRQGVAITVFAKTGEGTHNTAASIHHADVVGTRAAKLSYLKRTAPRHCQDNEVAVHAPYYFFVPRRAANQNYVAWPALNAIFQQYRSGVQTKRDQLFVGFTPDEVATKVHDFLTTARSGRFDDDVPAWLRERGERVTFDSTRIRPYLVAPFDVRWVYYEPHLIGRARYDVVRHLTADRPGLVFVRQTTNACTYDNVLATRFPASDRAFYSVHGAPFIAPLFLRTERGDSVRPNLSPAFLNALADRTGLRQVESSLAVDDGFDSVDAFHWIYAVLHWPGYRREFAEALRIDFPRIPLPCDAHQFAAMCRLGHALCTAHLAAQQEVTAPRVEATPVVQVDAGYPKRETDGRLFFSRQETWSRSVPETVWSFRIGGYRVVERWLKQRRARGLTTRDLARLGTIVAAIEQTVTVMQQLDQTLTLDAFNVG